MAERRFGKGAPSPVRDHHILGCEAGHVFRECKCDCEVFRHNIRRASDCNTRRCPICSHAQLCRCCIPLVAASAATPPQYPQSQHHRLWGYIKGIGRACQIRGSSVAYCDIARLTNSCDRLREGRCHREHTGMRIIGVRAQRHRRALSCRQAHLSSHQHYLMW